MSELDDLNVALGFQNWAEDRGYDLNISTAGVYTNLETQAAWLGFEAAHGPAGSKGAGQQIFARIKKTSEYAHQTGEVFPVRVGKAPFDDYVIHGGPGGLYRLRDVALYVNEDGKQYRIN